MFFIAYTFKGLQGVCKTSHSTCRTNAILKYFVPRTEDHNFVLTVLDFPNRAYLTCFTQISLWDGDAFVLCNKRMSEDKKFHFINTSNLADHTSLLNILLTCSKRLERCCIEYLVRKASCFTSIVC